MPGAADPNETLVRIQVDVPSKYFDLVSDLITGDFEAGTQELDETPDGLRPIVFYAPLAVADTQIAMLKTYVATLGDGGGRCRIISHEINNVEWVSAYRDSIKAVRIEPDILVRPPWARPQEGITHDIIIEPKMAFGTGTHETTRSCMHVIRERFRSGQRFLDLGCGSGILSILAAQLGAAYIKAIDYDLLAVDNSVENFAVNDVAVPNDILLGSIEKAAGDQPYDFVCANIIKSAILETVDKLVAATARPGTLVLSGLLQQDLDDIGQALRRLGVDRYETLPDNEWRTLVITREG